MAVTEHARTTFDANGEPMTTVTLTVRLDVPTALLARDVAVAEYLRWMEDDEVDALDGTGVTTDDGTRIDHDSEDLADKPHLFVSDDWYDCRICDQGEDDPRHS